MHGGRCLLLRQLLIVLLDNGKPPLPVVTSPPPAEEGYDSEVTTVELFLEPFLDAQVWFMSMVDGCLWISVKSVQ